MHRENIDKTTTEKKKKHRLRYFTPLFRHPISPTLNYNSLPTINPQGMTFKMIQTVYKNMDGRHNLTEVKHSLKIS